VPATIQKVTRCGLVLVAIAGFATGFAGCGGSQSGKITQPTKQYEPPPPESHQSLGGPQGGAKRSLSK